MSRRARVIARRRPETLEEWCHEAKQGRFVTRGELMWFLNLADEAQQRRAHDAAWYRRWWRAVLRPFRGRWTKDAEPEEAAA